MILKSSGVAEVSGKKSGGINYNKLDKLRYILSEGLYKDPESAVIVEITNNAVDASRESGKNTPVYVDFKDSVMTISDTGIGMTKEFFEDFFMEMLSSTKEDNPDDIG
jgi:HSP90 family molecular chaperone